MLGAVAVALILTTSPAPGARPAPRLAVVELSTPPTMIGLGGQITQAILREAERQQYTVVPPDEIHRLLGQAGEEELGHCEGNPACVATRLSGLAARRA